MTDFNNTDMGNSERLVARHGSKLRYVPAWGWLLYDDLRWARVDESRVMELAKETVRAMQDDSLKIEATNSRQETGKWALTSESELHLRSMVRLSEGALPADVGDFDKDPWLLNVLDGTIDLRTGELKPHDPKDLITKLAPVAYTGEALGGRWDSFLLEVFNNDRDLVDYVQRAIGYSLTGLSTEDKFFIAYGSGSNGKSTLFGVLQAALGDYADTASTKIIISEKYGNKPDGELAKLVGKRFVTMSETADGEQLDIKQVKAITGGEPIPAKSLYRDPFTFKPQFTLFLSTNNRPEIDEHNTAVWRRLRLIPFTVTFESDPKGIKSRKLDEALQADFPAILRWAVEGTRKWQENGLNEPESVREATKEYQEDQDDLADFIAECCNIAPTIKAKASELYDAYTEWLDPDVRLQAMSKVDFGKELKRRYPSGKSRGNIVYRGIGLKPVSRVIQEAERIAKQAPSFDDDPD